MKRWFILFMFFAGTGLTRPCLSANVPSVTIEHAEAAAIALAVEFPDYTNNHNNLQVPCSEICSIDFTLEGDEDVKAKTAHVSPFFPLESLPRCVEEITSPPRVSFRQASSRALFKVNRAFRL